MVTFIAPDKLYKELEILEEIFALLEQLPDEYHDLKEEVSLYAESVSIQIDDIERIKQ